MGERRGTKALELWCRRMIEGYPGVKIDNMTTSWRDGLAFCAMVHHFRPDLIDFDKLNKTDIYYNNELAFRTAEIHLGIPALLDAADMASYEVPDRLSILTYLSQYYQTFASQDSPNRLNKRPSTGADKSPLTLTKTSGPPAKVAHIVGGGGGGSTSVLKREPCQKCNLPVFLAERLVLGKKLFHRTCLKCARCQSQLSPGSFYETEVDGEFCCETCPDEEKEFTLKERLKSDISVNEDANKSFTEKLAMFQTDGKGLLQKSLSDEEKSKSLKRLTELYSHQDQTYKANRALSNFINNQIETAQSITTTSSIKSDNSSTSSDEETENEDPPDLPLTKPPSPSISDRVNERITSPDTSQLSLKMDPVNNPQPLNESPPIRSSSTINIISDNIPLHKEMPVDAFYELSNVTKEESRHNEKQDVVDCVPQIRNKNISGLTVNSMVRSRLSQFETKIGAEQQIASKNRSKKLDVSEKGDSSNVSNVQANEIEVPAADQIKLKSSDVISDIRKYEDETRQDEIFKKNVKSETYQYTNEVQIDAEYDQKDVELCEKEKENLKPESAEHGSVEPESVEHKSVDPERVVAKRIEPECVEREYVEPVCVEREHVEPECVEREHVEPECVEREQRVELELVEPEPMETDHVESDNNNKKDDITSNVNEITSNDPINNESMTSFESISVKVKTEEVARAVVPVPRSRASKTYQDETAKPVPVKRAGKHKKSSKEKITEINGTLAKDVNLYPLDLNPFGSDDDDNDEISIAMNKTIDKKREPISCNPFDSSDDEVELEKDDSKKYTPSKDLSKSRMSLNPFGSDSEDDDEGTKPVRTPVPTPRKVVTSSLNPTPEPTPRLSRAPYNTNHDIYGSEASLSSATIYRTSDLLSRNSYFHGSTNSLASSSGSAHRRKKGRAPLPPTLMTKSSNELSPSKESSPSHSTRTSPSPRKKRPAPAPPSSTPIRTGNKLESIPSIVFDNSDNQTTDESIYITAIDNTIVNVDSASREFHVTNESSDIAHESLTQSDENSITNTMRLIPLEASLLEDFQHDSNDHRNISENDSVIFRRRIVPYSSESPIIDDSLVSVNEKSLNHTDDVVEQNARQWQKMKENKETQNKNRQSQISLSSPEPDHVYSNKSSYGKWKRRKGPAPALPVPPRKVLQMVPLQEIRHELEVIEVQQLGLEKQGVMLEKMIRERCEGTDPQFDEYGQPQLPPDTPNTKEVEDLILQLFELVNEKNELFRRQAELMYLRRQHRLEQEQADIEYEIRVLMAQPERNKTDCDKAREEALITRLVEVVQLRNEVIECLEMDRLREAEEDQSIKQRLELHTAKRDVELSKQTPTKLSKKEKKKQKESKKLFKQKKMDADKDADETEIQSEKTKKKKRKFLF